MISNERPSPFAHPLRAFPRPPVEESTLNTGRVQVERKTFVLTLKENPRGRFLRITEDVGGRHDSIIIPASGLPEFQKMLGEFVQSSKTLPSKSQPS